MNRKERRAAEREINKMVAKTGVVTDVNLTEFTVNGKTSAFICDKLLNLASLAAGHYMLGKDVFHTLIEEVSAIFLGLGDISKEDCKKIWNMTNELRYANQMHVIAGSKNAYEVSVRVVLTHILDMWGMALSQKM